MRIKILVFVPRSETGMMVDLQPNEIIAVDASVGEELINAKKAELLF